MNFENDTIVALATPAGTGAISIIRLSGEGSIPAVDKIFKGSVNLSECQSHTIHYGKVYDEEQSLIDDVLISIYRNPNSYTGEDSIEISTHGSPLIVQKIIQTLLKSDIRVAEPGEFTKRAFLNGKIDLAQAEAVVDIINSRTEASLRGARNQLDGILSNKVKTLREELIKVSSLIELELDFAEEDVQFVSSKEILKLIDHLVEEINQLLNTYSFGKVLKDGVNVALVGKPNVGKSSILNYILKESRSIVSEIPGTTRDIIREEVSIDGILFRIIDTAGIRVTEEEIEREGVARSRNAVENSDIVVFISDEMSGFDTELYNNLLELTTKARIISVQNKIDLGLPQLLNIEVKVSAKTGEGMNDLLNYMKKKSMGIESYSEKTAIVSTLRHSEALNRAKTHLINAQNTIHNKLSGEFVSLDLRNAEDALGEIIGEVTSEDILNSIFSKFCIGK
jgi:tRNA modification GTPase